MQLHTTTIFIMKWHKTYSGEMQSLVVSREPRFRMYSIRIPYVLVCIPWSAQLLKFIFVFCSNCGSLAASIVLNAIIQNQSWGFDKITAAYKGTKIIWLTTYFAWLKIVHLFPCTPHYNFPTDHIETMLEIITLVLNVDLGMVNIVYFI